MIQQRAESRKGRKEVESGCVKYVSKAGSKCPAAEAKQQMFLLLSWLIKSMYLLAYLFISLLDFSVIIFPPLGSWQRTQLSSSSPFYSHNKPVK